MDEMRVLNKAIEGAVIGGILGGGFMLLWGIYEFFRKLNRNKFSIQSLRKEEKGLSDFSKAALVFPEIEREKNRLQPFGPEVQNEFVQTLLEKKSFSNPLEIANDAIHNNMLKRFSGIPEAAAIGVKLIESGKLKEAAELQDLTRIIGKEIVANGLDKFKIILGYSDKVSDQNPIDSVYSRDGGYIIVLKSGKVVAKLNHNYTTFEDFVSFREKANETSRSFTELMAPYSAANLNSINSILAELKIT